MYIVQYAQYSTVIMVNVLFSTVHIFHDCVHKNKCTLHTHSLFTKNPRDFSNLSRINLEIKNYRIMEIDKGVGERRGGGMKTFKLKLRSKN